ncbi:MAG: anti-sigma factor [Pseudomonadota bacterium]|nr:anti-sigma factor [Pseudomonadota bacterium]
MECTHSQQWMAAYLDGELDASATLQLELHLAGCAQCDAALAQLQALRARVAQEGSRYRAPEHLKHRIRSALREQQPRPRPPLRASRAALWRWFGPGAGAVGTAAFAVTLALYLQQPSPAERLEQELVASHVRALMPNHLADVASTDMHTVKPWFAGKLDFSPPVIDLAQQGYALVGGRLDYVAERPVAAMVYQHRKHILNLYVWPAAGDAAARADSRQGYQLLRWRQQGMQFAAVSDIGAADLAAFGAALRGQLGGGAKQH